MLKTHLFPSLALAIICRDRIRPDGRLRDQVTFSDVGWTDITATTAATTTVLEALGYETDVKVLSVPVTYTSLVPG